MKRFGLTVSTYGLELVRSDCSDGGWSLHLPEIEGEDGLSPAVVYGDARWIEETAQNYGGWDRPIQADYDEAAAKLVRMIKREDERGAA